MSEILQNSIPPEMLSDVGLPGMAPCAPHDWVRLDEAYAGQMAARSELLATQEQHVLWYNDAGLAASFEVLEEVLKLLPALGFSRSGNVVACPDGRVVDVTQGTPLWILGHLIQEDICILQKQGDEHVLTGAVLCFPASWRLAEKAGKPLIGIHEPVEEYDASLARRVQRLFDGVKLGRPLWRFNRLWYDDPTLFQPRSAKEPRRIEPDQKSAPYIRSERQCIVRMPISDAVVFSIHTFVVNS